MTTYVNASCQCELNAFRVVFDIASLPISVGFCHCSMCRHSSGQMLLCHAPIQGVPLTRANGLSVHSSRSPSRVGFRNGEEDETTPSYPSGNHGTRKHHHASPSVSAAFLAPPPIFEIEEADTPYDFGDSTTYKTSPDVTRYFCTSCSAQLFWVHHDTKGEDTWDVAVGVLDRVDGLVKRRYHIYVGDTLDGGAADHIQAIDGVKLPRYMNVQGGEELPLGWKADSLLATTASNQLTAFCHCKTVSFVITRPSEESFIPTAAYPDLLYPYGVSHLSKIVNGSDEKWWLRPTSSSNPTKYLAGHCMCNFCRHCSGFEIQSWAYIPLANILRPDLTPLCLENEADRPNGLKQFISSPGEYREFCGTCGATAFSWKAGTSDLINVSVGLFDESIAGARAQDWLEWNKERVSFQEKALSPSLAHALEEGIKA